MGRCLSCDMDSGYGVYRVIWTVGAVYCITYNVILISVIIVPELLLCTVSSHMIIVKLPIGTSFAE